MPDPTETNQSWLPDLDCWYLSGPTASGKTPIGIEMARRLNAEIISLDSMSIYRGMDIGTAKPSLEQQRGTAHHLIDIREPDEEFSLAEFMAAAKEKTKEIRERGRRVLFVGGTPLYLKSLLRGVHEGPPADWEFRRQVAEEIERVGVEALRERLMQVDPLSAEKLHPHDQRRMIRALEVYKITGQPISHQQTQFEFGRPAADCKVFTLFWPRERLHERIGRRVEWMFEAGLIDEVRGLLEKHGGLGRTASQAVGYRESIEHLEGSRSLEETVEKVKARTRQFARRQETWFNSLSECRRVECDDQATAEAMAERILGQIPAE